MLATTAVLSRPLPTPFHPDRPLDLAPIPSSEDSWHPVRTTLPNRTSDRPDNLVRSVPT